MATLNESDITDWQSDGSAVVDPEAAPPEAPPEAPVEAATPDLEGGSGPDDPQEPEESEEEVIRTRDERGRWTSKRQAKRDPINRINELTRRLRETEEREKAKDARLAAIEARTAPAPKVTTAPTPPAPFSDPEPTIDQFADKDDPYGEWILQKLKWQQKKERHDEAVAQVSQQTEAHRREIAAWREDVSRAHQQRLAEAVKSQPELVEKLQSVKGPIPELLNLAIELDNEGPAIALFLATHPTELDTFSLLTAAQPIDGDTVARTQRLLREKMSAVANGAASSSKPFPTAPRPLTPLRTGSTTRGTDVPGDDDSLEAHEQAFPTRAFGIRRR